MKVKLFAYLNKNLGDDLFIKTIADRYNNVNFDIVSKNTYHLADNINVINSKIYRIVKLLSSNSYYYKYNILLGGSMFIENKSIDYSALVDKNSNLYILGSNFGPYYSNEYLSKCKSLFKKAKDVCFRDKKSYDLFKELPNVRYASDIVFSMNISDIKIESTNNVVISVINCDKKTDNISSKDYEDKIIELIIYFNSKGYNTTLMSFCKDEGDEECINSIINKMKKNNVRTIPSKYYYRGNLHEALNVLGCSKIIVGTRFHANILGMLMDKVIIPIAYSDKTINVLNDMNFKGKIFDARKLEEFKIDSIEEKDLNYKINVSKQKIDALKHFDKLDNILNEGRK